eukprot:Selendium_serpulae@DN4849_c0_g1_i1.p1
MLNFKVNAMGPLLVTQALEEQLLYHYRQLHPPQDKSVTTSKPKSSPFKSMRPRTETVNNPLLSSLVVNLSARVGSIRENKRGGWYSYRMSKTALNQATRTSALQLSKYGCAVIALHPGTTDTDLSRPFQRNVPPHQLFPSDLAVNQMLGVFAATEFEHTGGFFDYLGKVVSF